MKCSLRWALSVQRLWKAAAATLKYGHLILQRSVARVKVQDSFSGKLWQENNHSANSVTLWYVDLCYKEILPAWSTWTRLPAARKCNYCGELHFIAAWCVVLILLTTLIGTHILSNSTHYNSPAMNTTLMNCTMFCCRHSVRGVALIF